MLPLWELLYTGRSRQCQAIWHSQKNPQARREYLAGRVPSIRVNNRWLEKAAWSCRRRILPFRARVDQPGRPSSTPAAPRPDRPKSLGARLCRVKDQRRLRGGRRSISACAPASPVNPPTEVRSTSPDQAVASHGGSRCSVPPCALALPGQPSLPAAVRRAVRTPPAQGRRLPWHAARLRERGADPPGAGPALRKGAESCGSA